MAITRTPIIDDDGTGTTGTVIDNAWKTELYNQIDASGGSPSAPIVKANQRGTTAAAGVSNLHQVYLPGLGDFDTVTVECAFHTFPGVLQPIRLFYTGTGSPIEIARLDTVGGAGAQLLGSLTQIRAGAGSPAQVVTTSWGADIAGPGKVLYQFASLTGPDTFTTPWTLVLQYAGVPAGDTLLWMVSVVVYPKGPAL